MRQLDLDRDAAICKAMTADLESYLLADTVYRTLSNTGPYHNRYPQLTLGGLLIRLHHLTILQDTLSPETYNVFIQAHDTADALLDSWRVRFEHKIIIEIKAHLRAWSVFLGECVETDGKCADEYPTQAMTRTMIEVLLDTGEEKKLRGLTPLRAQLSGLDWQLQSISASDVFVWDSALEQAYPADKFWWLYVIPVENENTAN
jgi:hypothetical protein